jgi:hypothetical protein
MQPVEDRQDSKTSENAFEGFDWVQYSAQRHIIPRAGKDADSQPQKEKIAQGKGQIHFMILVDLSPCRNSAEGFAVIFE